MQIIFRFFHFHLILYGYNSEIIKVLVMKNTDTLNNKLK